MALGMRWVAVALTFGTLGSPAFSAALSWETDYIHAMDTANRQGKLLLICFCDSDNRLSQRLDAETFAADEVVKALGDYVCLRLPVSYKIPGDEQGTRLLDHPVLREMLGQPGIAIADFTHRTPERHAAIISMFPLTPGLFYGPAEMKVILDLPPGTLTQRTIIYAVRTHPERPASANGTPNANLLDEAQNHSQYQAAINRQGHHFWSSRFPRISGLIGTTAREVCAESWPGQHLVEAAVECVRCWRLSSGHWSAVNASTGAYGYDMRLGSNGVWYATGIMGMR